MSRGLGSLIRIGAGCGIIHRGRNVVRLLKLGNQILSSARLVCLCWTHTAFAQLNVPSDGSDGVLNITSNTVIDLSLATTGNWDANNSANAGRGVYDSNKWAVVFKYSSVNIATNALASSSYKVTFINHPSHAPVVWLVQSNVLINGVVSLTGKPKEGGVAALSPQEPGPGGFRGGASGPSGAGGGFGPSPGPQNHPNYRSSYGNPQILPLIGGSGAEAAGGENGPSGGGAILIAAGGTVTVNGAITSKSSLGITEAIAYSSSSSGGAIKIIANQILGSGMIDTERDGRTRMEANLISSQLNIFPNTVAVPAGPINNAFLQLADIIPSLGLGALIRCCKPKVRSKSLVSFCPTTWFLSARRALSSAATARSRCGQTV